ncbi:cytochrome aa3 quinol oxidase subunit 2 [Scopulibacillus darangshiensis]|uniref:Quinol oxidase subunit 2 n=1 Tax=Scopulibacillus darangshiensis TaxID=442528 RepID=A0A4R2NI52_9BACL|nr:cytochrome aa3 quinol oxidase subunit II [Scopulibacillus darangshiensis]TCP20865.1 cytochrome aa3 quinol oxidase subunit 2 [Scopulibacillus darangshiensis]
MKRLTLKSLGVLALFLVFLTGCTNKVAVLNPQGPVAKQQYDLIIWSFILMAIVVAGVLIIFIYVLVRYGRKNSKGYDPEDEGNAKLEALWTIIPIIIVILLAVPTVKTLYGLEGPPKPANATGKKVEPITIEVTSVDWKWLFRYPKQGIETVNYAVIPEDTPVKIKLKAIGAMNSFWVPELAGQQYTMPNMPMNMWIQADHPGDYLGRSANFSGKGFAHMSFHILAKKDANFDAWVKDVKANKPALTMEKYKKLLEPDIAGEMTFSSYPKVLDKKDAAMEQHMNNDDMEGGMNHDSGH